MSIVFKEQCEENSKFNDDRQREFQTRVDSDEEKTLDPVYLESQDLNLHQYQMTTDPNDEFKQNRTQTSNIEQSPKHRSAVLANKKQYLESIRLSYLVLSNPIQTSPEKRKKKLLKKSFVVISEEQDNNINEDKIKQSLKTPLKIDIKKLESNNKFTQLSQGLQLFNGKSWQTCHFDIDMKTQELIVSNLHIPFLTISKIKIYKPQGPQKLKEIKITYQKVNEQGILNLNLNAEKHVKKIPSNYAIFQEILTHKLSFQNRLKQTKWDKKPHICESIVFESYIFGQIYKKSQFLGKWERRYIVLNGQGIYSYKSAQKKKQHSFFIEKESIEYIWSRFDLVDGHLVIKIKHGMKQTEFGIPIANYSYMHYKNWLYYFYRLMATD